MIITSKVDHALFVKDAITLLETRLRAQEVVCNLAEVLGALGWCVCFHDR